MTVLQTSPPSQRGKAFSARLKDEAGDARPRQARQFRHSLGEQVAFSAKQRTQQQSRSQCAAGAQRARELGSAPRDGMTRRSNRSPDRAPRGRRARRVRAPSIATLQWPNPSPPPPRCALLRLPAATVARAALRAGSRRRRSGQKCVQAIRLEDRSPRLPISARTASNGPISASAAFARGGRFGRRANAMWVADVSGRCEIDKVGVGQHGRMLEHRGG